MRRRADLAFMVQMYEMAYTSYHTAKGDFGNDQAWMHYAGSLVRHHHLSVNFTLFRQDGTSIVLPFPDLANNMKSNFHVQLLKYI